MPRSLGSSGCRLFGSTRLIRVGSIMFILVALIPTRETILHDDAAAAPLLRLW